MRRFAQLFAQLDRTRSTRAKVDALVAYWRDAEPDDAAWALHVLRGGHLRRVVTGAELRAWVAAHADLPPWLVEACWHRVGDLAETLALLAAPAAEPDRDEELSLAGWVERVLSLREMEAVGRSRRLSTWCHANRFPVRFLVFKLLLGALRVGVGKGLVQRALAEVSGLEDAVVARRLVGWRRADAGSWKRLFDPATAEEEAENPYPFCLAHPLPGDPAALGEAGRWWVEWKWDGIRAQLLRRGRGARLWSRGEEVLDGAFPEVLEAACSELPPGCVLDGEILVWRSGRPAPFSELQRRLGRKRPSARLRAELPVAFMAYDLLEEGGVDRRESPLRERRERLAHVLAGSELPFRLSPGRPARAWDEVVARRERARELGCEGLMLKAEDSPYVDGRRRGTWWKWKCDPYVIDAVLIYAQAGHGRRANLCTDYTFALWRADELVPVARAYFGLDDAEIERLDRWLRRHTKERFGPVRAVEPEQVFELAFEGISRSARHRSGIALRFPRIRRWREDKRAEEADRLITLEELLAGEERHAQG